MPDEVHWRVWWSGASEVPSSALRDTEAQFHRHSRREGYFAIDARDLFRVMIDGSRPKAGRAQGFEPG